MTKFRRGRVLIDNRSKITQGTEMVGKGVRRQREAGFEAHLCS